MTADTLRRAAAVMRERAEAATPGPWDAAQLSAAGKWGVYQAGEDRGGMLALTGRGEGVEEDAEHIASWHPAVVLAVADWLDEAADHLDVYEDDDLDPALRPHVCPTAIEGPECSVLGQALTVARAYLKEET